MKEGVILSTDIGKLISSRRKELNLTQEQLAQKLYVSRKVVSRWELNERIPNTMIVKDLCKVLNISIDEFFINAAPYLKLYNVNDMGFANLIIKIIYDNFSLVACAGIGPNMFLAKCALDLEAKHTSTRIAKWGLNEVKTKLHKVTPLSKMWSISSRNTPHFA